MKILALFVFVMGFGVSGIAFGNVNGGCAEPTPERLSIQIDKSIAEKSHELVSTKLSNECFESGFNLNANNFYNLVIPRIKSCKAESEKAKLDAQVQIDINKKAVETAGSLDSDASAKGVLNKGEVALLEASKIIYSAKDFCDKQHGISKQISDNKKSTDKNICNDGEKVSQDQNVALAITDKCNADFEAQTKPLDKIIFDNNLKQIEIAAAKASIASTMGGVGLMVAPVAGTLIADGVASKAVKKKIEKAEFDRGVIEVDGKKIECFSTSNYIKEECRKTMLRLCQTKEHQKSSGCQAFAAYDCAPGNPSEGSNFCVFQEAVAFCSKSIPELKDSPGCQWIKSRPKACQKDPDHVSCLANFSPETLTKNCELFAADPLCRAHADGKVVTSPDGGQASGITRYTGPLMNGKAKAGSTNLNSLLGERRPILRAENLWINNTKILKEMKLRGALK